MNNKIIKTMGIPYNIQNTVLISAITSPTTKYPETYKVGSDFILDVLTSINQLLHTYSGKTNLYLMKENAKGHLLIALKQEKYG